MGRRIRFEEFVFDRDSGELFRREESGPVACGRLTPQPARLLSLLVERSPEVVSQKAIREHLWPDVKVDFEKSLHFCVRQIRAACGESASEPRIIQTVPRQGYRFIPSWSALPDDEAAEPTAEESRGISGGRRTILGVLLLMGAAWGLWAAFGRGDDPPAGPPPLRVAVMSFVSPTTGVSRGIAEHVLERLANHPETSGFEVVGPTTTAAWNDSDESLRDLANALRIDFIVNGRFVPREGRERLLGEIIRASDGAHVHVKYYDGLEPEAAARALVEALLQATEG